VLIRRAIVLGCGALAVLGAACSSDGSSKAVSTTTTARSPTTRAPTTTTTPPAGASPFALQNLILSDVPGGFKLQPDDVADTGPTNLSKAALDDVSCNVGCDARQALVGSGFVDGYQRQWTSVDASGSTIDQDFLYLYQFKTPEGAQQYAQHWQETLLATGQGAPVEGFVPAFIPGAMGIKVSDTLGSTGVAIFAKGPYAVRAVVNGGPGVDQSGPATALASQQYQHLP
jgi:hypothetical protein